jgi:flagellar hook-basal body complex protein FliE
MAMVGAIGSGYGIPDIRMRPASTPVEAPGLGSGSGQLMQVGELQWPAESLRAGAAGPSGFGEILKAGIEQTAALGHSADAKAQAFATGALDDLHGTMITAKEAEISLRLVGSVRTKLLDAFHEIWRINV